MRSTATRRAVQRVQPQPLDTNFRKELLQCRVGLRCPFVLVILGDHVVFLAHLEYLFWMRTRSLVDVGRTTGVDAPSTASRRVIWLYL